MSNEKRAISRKATFTVETVKGKRVFTAINKRAHNVAKRLGKRSKITLAEMRQTKGLGSYKMYQYTKEGTLKPIKF